MYRNFPFYQNLQNTIFSFGWFTPKKVKELIIDRRIQAFVKQHKFNPYQEVDILQQIVELQNKIYKLDKYGENNWKLDNQKITNLWNAISNFITQLNFTVEETKILLAKMYNYMQVEINLRTNNLPCKISISEYYELKICDVHLQRKIIKSKSKSAFNIEYYRLWELIDITSEILDDLADIKEDSKDYNCNRLLISNHFRGTNIIVNEYDNYINSLKNEFYNIIESQEFTIKEYLKELFKLKLISLESQLKNLDISKYKSKIIDKLNSVNIKLNFISTEFSVKFW